MGRRAKLPLRNRRRRYRRYGLRSGRAYRHFLTQPISRPRSKRRHFRGRADAQRKASKEAIDKLHKSATNFADSRREEVETAAKHMKVDAEAAKAKLEKLRKSGSDSWSAMQSALAETSAGLDKTNQAVQRAA